MNDSLARILSENVGLISLAVVLLPVVLLIPTLIAVVRSLPDRRKIAMVNLAGMIFLTPWLAALAWAVLGKTNESIYERILTYKRWIILLLAIGLLGLFAGLWLIWDVVDRYRNSELSDQFVIAQVEAPPGSRAILASGRIVPRSLVPVSSEISGRISGVFVEANDEVVIGQPLATIEAPNLTSLTKQAIADLDIAQSELARAEAVVTSARARLVEQQAVYERRQQIFDRGFLSRAEYEAEEAELRSREAELESARAQVQGSEAQLAAARARLVEARDEASRATIVSPVSGTVLSRSAEPGQTVVSSFQTEELFEIAENLETMRLELIVDETEIGHLNEGRSITFSVDAFPDQRFPGTLTMIERAPVESDGTVGYRVFVDINNSAGEFFSGMTVLAEFAPNIEAKTLWIPSSALVFAPVASKPRTDGEQVVHVVRGNRLESAIVRIVSRSEAMVIVTSDSISIGDQVATGFVNAAS